MSMMGHFREIKPELLERLQQDPSLTEAVVYADLVGGEASSEVDVNTMLKGLPTKQRELMKAALSSYIDAVMKLLPEKQRQSMKALFSSLTPEQRSRSSARSG